MQKKQKNNFVLHAPEDEIVLSSALINVRAEYNQKCVNNYAP